MANCCNNSWRSFSISVSEYFSVGPKYFSRLSWSRSFLMDCISSSFVRMSLNKSPSVPFDEGASPNVLRNTMRACSCTRCKVNHCRCMRASSSAPIAGVVIFSVKSIFRAFLSFSKSIFRWSISSLFRKCVSASRKSTSFSDGVLSCSICNKFNNSLLRFVCVCHCFNRSNNCVRVAFCQGMSGSDLNWFNSS